jgi:heat shock protein HslJ
MRIARFGTGLVLVSFLFFSQAEAKHSKTSVTGTLSRVMAMGGESTGWAIQLDPAITIDGKQLTSIEVESHKLKQLERLESKRVKATGVITHRQGVEMGERTILVVSSMKESKAGAPPASAQAVPFSLSGSEWLLEDLGGSGVIDNIQATLTFPETGKLAGNGSCNRFFGPAEIDGNTLKLGPLGSTRMACPEAVMNQETKYMQALQASERFEWKDPYLMIYCKGFEKPLRFTRMQSSKPATS